MNHYECLGVEPDAPRSVIHAAYRTRARLLHPDVAGSAGADRIVAVNEAWHVLGDPVRRRAYDARWSRRSTDARDRVSDVVVDRGDGTFDEPVRCVGNRSDGARGLRRLFAVATCVSMVASGLFLLIAMIEGH